MASGMAVSKWTIKNKNLISVKTESNDDSESNDDNESSVIYLANRSGFQVWGPKNWKLSYKKVII